MNSLFTQILRRYLPPEAWAMAQWVVKRIKCSYRVHEFGSRHPHGSLQLPVTAIPQVLIPSSNSSRALRCTNGDIHTLGSTVQLQPRACWCLRPVLAMKALKMLVVCVLPVPMLMSMGRPAAEGILMSMTCVLAEACAVVCALYCHHVEVCGTCWLCVEACDPCSAWLKGQGSYFCSGIDNTDVQLKKRDIEGLWDNPYLYPTHCSQKVTA